jgi:hypothetical protein
MVFYTFNFALSNFFLLCCIFSHPNIMSITIFHICTYKRSALKVIPSYLLPPPHTFLSYPHNENKETRQIIMTNVQKVRNLLENFARDSGARKQILYNNVHVQKPYVRLWGNFILGISILTSNLV